jgi:PEGA domain
MGSERVPAEHERIGSSGSKTTLHIEMHSSERHVLTSFREQFMRWVNDRGASGFARDAGTPQKISFEEGESEAPGLSAVLNLDLVWNSRHGSGTKATQRWQSVSSTASAIAPPPAFEAHQKFVFFPDPDSETPRHQAASLFDGRTLHPMPSRTEWVRMERPALLELLHKSVAFTVRTYDNITPRLAAVVKHPSRLLSETAAFRASLFPGPVRVRLTKSTPLEHGWFSAVRTGGLVAAVVCATFLLVTLAYRSRSSDVLAADQNARAESPRSRDVSRPPQPAPPALANGADAGIPSPFVATRVSTAGGTDGVSDGSGVSAGVAGVTSAVALDAIDSPRRAAPSTVREVSPARTTVPVAVLAQNGTVGSLVVASEPAGAAVSINGVTHGYTPLKIENLAVGTRVVRIDLAGYERWSWAVNVVANKRTPITVKLQPEARRIGASN